MAPILISTTSKNLPWQLRRRIVRFLAFRFSHSSFLNLASMTVGGIRVRPAVYRAAWVGRRLLVSSAGEKTKDGRHDAQHEDNARYADADGKTPLGDAYRVVP